MPTKRKAILWLIGDIGLIAVGIAHLVIGKYYSNSIPPLAFVFLAFSLMWFILGIVRLNQTISILESLFGKGKINGMYYLDNTADVVYNKKRG